MHNADALFGVHGFPGDDLVGKALLLFEFGEAGFIFEADKFAPLEHAQDFLFVVFEVFDGVLREEERTFVALDLDFDIVDFGVDGERDVARQRPRRGRPDEDLAVFANDRKLEEHGVVGDVFIRAGHLVLRQRCAAARAPGHRLILAADPAVVVTLFEEVPDTADVRVGIGKVGVVPLHPLAKAFALLRDDAGKMLHTVLALLGELVHPVVFNILFRFKAELFFHFHLDPQTLGVKAVLAAAVVTLHRLVADKDILERTAPGVVDTHRVVRGDRAVDKAEHLVSGVFLFAFFEALILFPKVEDLVLHVDKAVAFFCFSHWSFLRCCPKRA